MKMNDWKIVALSSVLGGLMGIAGTATLLHFRLFDAPAIPVLPGLAQGTTPRSPVDPVCQKDADALCAGELSENRRDACLQEKVSQVSPACRERLQAVRASLKACEREMAKFCPQAGFGGGRMIRCLSDYYEELSSGCRQRIGTRH